MSLRLRESAKSKTKKSIRMDLTWLAVHPVRHAVWFEWRFASVRLLRETVHRSWRLLQSASHCSHTHLHARRRTDTGTPMHSSTLRGFLVSAVPLKIIWRFAVGGEAGTRSTTGPTPSGPRSCSAGSWLSSGSRPWEKIWERKKRKVSFSWSGQCLVGCQLNGSKPCPWLPTWWHAGRGRTASDPSANRWKLWFSGTRQCPALGAGTATGERGRGYQSELKGVRSERRCGWGLADEWRVTSPTRLSGTAA